MKYWVPNSKYSEKGRCSGQKKREKNKERKKENCPKRSQGLI